MAKADIQNSFVMVPLLRAIDRLPAEITADGVTIACTGVVTSAPIIGDFEAYRAFVRGPRIEGHIDLISSSSFRSELTLSLRGARPRVVESLLKELRRQLVDQPPVAPQLGARMDVCRTA